MAHVVSRALWVACMALCVVGFRENHQATSSVSPLVSKKQHRKFCSVVLSLAAAFTSKSDAMQVKPPPPSGRRVGPGDHSIGPLQASAAADAVAPPIDVWRMAQNAWHSVSTKATVAGLEMAASNFGDPMAHTTPSPAASFEKAWAYGRRAAMSGAQDNTQPNLIGIHIDRMLGRGYFGVVWAGRMMDGREVAVKSFGKTDRRRVHREIEISKKFGKPATHGYHPFLEFVAWQEDPTQHRAYMVSQVAHGTVERDIIGQPFEVVGLFLRTRMMLETAQGVAAMANAGFMHRDIKPDNLMLLNLRDGPHVKIADWGLACAVDPSVHVGMGHIDGDDRGNLPYMAPERFGEELSLKSDVYAMSIVMYQLLFGQLPSTLHEAYAQYESGYPFEAIAIASHFDVTEDELFARAMRAARLGRIQVLVDLLELLRAMQIRDESRRIDAQSVWEELARIVDYAPATHHSLPIAENTLHIAKEEALAACSREGVFINY